MTKIIRVEGDGAARLQRALNSLSGATGKVGWFEKSKYDGSGTPVATVAAVQEYGYPAKNIPARPFIRPAIEKNKSVWTRIAEAEAKKILEGSSNARAAMEAIGSRATGDIVESISQVYSPALAETTILARISRSKNLSKKKGKLSEKQIGNITKPLVDTGLMVGTVTNVVETE